MTRLLLCLVVLTLAPLPALAQDPDLEGRQDRLAPITRSEDGRFVRIGKAELDDVSGTITVPGHLNQRMGAIELVACATGGKTHESLFLLDVEPIHLQLALIRLGLEALRPVRFAGDPEPPKGGWVYVYAEWEQDGKTVRHRVEDLIFSPAKGETMPQQHWVFAGSKTIQGNFMATVERSLITTYRDPYAIIDNPAESGTDDELFVPNAAVLPEVKTPVKVIIEKIPGKEKG